MMRATAAAKPSPETSIGALSDSARQAVKELADALEILRRRITILGRQRAELNDRPLSKADALARLDAWLGRERGQALDALVIRHFVYPSGRGRDDSLTLDSRHADAIWRGLMINEVRAAYAASIERFYLGADGIADVDRTAELARLDAEIREAEVAEEGLIRSLEAMGMDVLRRSNASPAVVLASDSEISPGERLGPKWE